MDVLADPSCLVVVRTPHLTAAYTDAVSTGECENSSILRLCGSIDAALPPSLPPASPPLPAANSLQRTIQTLPSLTPSHYPHVNEDPNHFGHDTPTSHPLTSVNPWAAPGDPHLTTHPLVLPLSLPLALPLPLPPATMMDPGTVPALPEECLLQPSRTCLGCFIETRDAAASDPSNLPIHDVAHDTISNRETSELDVRLSEVVQEDFGDTCPISDISIQCLSHDGETVSHYGDQLLSDQLLSYPLPKDPTGGVKRGGEGEEKSPEDSDDPEDEASAKNLYEGLLLDKVSGEEVLLANAGQDWGYFESFISESKMELLDLCSKNELSVNLFSEEDVDNLFDDEDDDSTLSSDVCSLKIRYESFQDNMREKTNVLQEETQFNFFPSVLANCAKKEEGGGGLLRRGVSAEDLQSKAEELCLGQEEEGKSRREGSAESPLNGSQGSTMSSPKINYLMDFSNTEDSGDYSDDSSCTGSSSDTPQDARQKKDRPQKKLNYGLRSKRKVRYSDDYLYDVDSIESERNSEKKEKTLIGQKEEEDVDWCPKKRRKSSRKEPPVVIKYIIINRFKGERYMSVKLGKLDPADATVSLSTEAVVKYQTLSPLKDFWQERWREREEQLRLAARDKRKRGIHLNSRRHRPFGSSHPKRKYKIANRLRVQRIHVLEQSDSALGLSVSDVGVTVKEDVRQSALGAGTIPVTGILHPSTIMSPSAMTKSRSQEREERESKRLGGGHKTIKIRKFKSEARLRSKIIKGGTEREGEGLGSVTNEADTCLATVLIEEPAVRAGVLGETDLSSATLHPHFSDNHTDTAQEKFPFIPTSCSPDKPPSSSSEVVETGVPVIPGGYLQTLLDVTDSSVGEGIAYFSQQQPTRQHFPLGLSIEEKQFASSLQLAQSCVLSPPSESELQQSPQNCPSFPPIWHPQLCPSQGFTSDTQDTPLLPGGFPSGLPLNDSLPVSGYSQLGTEPNRLLYEKNYLSEPIGLPHATDLQVCQQASEGQQGLQYQRATLCTDNGRLISYDSVGSLSAASSSNYSSLSIKSCEREGGEEDVRDGFLSHCSPKVLIQQSVDALTPLRESSDLLDISNFTPDKFRHSSLAELSPPETPNLSPQVVGREIKIMDKAAEYQDVGELGMENSREGKWNCEAMQQQLEQHSVRGFSMEGGQYQLDSFRGEEGLGLDKKNVNNDDFYKQTEEMMCGVKSTRLKRKGSYKQTTDSPKKGRGPRTTKAEKVKAPRQNSRSTKKIKAMLQGKATKSQAPLADSSSTRDWSGTGWSESNSLVGDDQREFEEPSNILSNIVSGMAEVQRFMMASIEPLWDPVSEACISPEANSLNLKTLKILSGTEPELKKKGSTGAGRGKKAGCKGGKNQTKFNPSHPLFPQLALGCHMFDKPNFINPGPAHKKLYRHKTSAKFPRIDTMKGKRVERDPNKDIALMASFEKLR
ncbi:neurite extension and migration factor isoform X2 [Osmerus eperlanus]